jgi:hypothetical protein
MTMFKKLKETVLTLIILITFLLDLGVLQPINHEPEPEPCQICVQMPPPPGAVLWI